MKRQLGWLMLVGGALLAFPGCGDDDDAVGNVGGSASHAGSGHGGEPEGQGGGAASDGSDECKVMGELCHAADSGSGAAHDCHEVGHEGDGASCLAEFAGCINTCVPEAPANLSLEDARCAALGELCHPVDDENGPLHACHELGHENDASICAAKFADCAQRCLAAVELLEHGEGGAGGGSGEHAHTEAGAGGTGGAPTAEGGTAGSGG